MKITELSNDEVLTFKDLTIREFFVGVSFNDNYLHIKINNGPTLNAIHYNNSAKIGEIISISNDTIIRKVSEILYKV